jgi:hypothetical protein
MTAMTSASNSPEPAKTAVQSAATGIQKQSALEGGAIPLPPLQTPAVPAPKPDRLLRICAGIDWLQALLVLALAFLTASFAVHNSDFFMHLSVGRHIVQGDYHWGEDPLCYTTAQSYWANHSWLYQWGLYRLYHLFGEDDLAGTVLVVLKAAGVALLALVMMRIRRRGQRIWWPALCTGLAIIALSPRLLFQPTLLSYLLLATTLWILSRRPAEGQLASTSFFSSPRRLWILPVLFLLWVNLDAWFFLGPLTLGLYLLGELVQKQFAPVTTGPDATTSADRTPLLLAFVAGLVACLLNPHFYRAWTLPVEFGLGLPEGFKGDPVFRRIFQSPLLKTYFADPALGLNGAGLCYYLLLLAGLLSFVFALLSSGVRWWRVLVWAGFAGLSVYNARLVPFFAVVGGPITALNLQDLSISLAGGSGRNQSAVHPGWALLGRVVAVLVTLGLLAATWPGWLQAAQQDRYVSWKIEPDASLQRTAQQLHEWHQAQLLKPGQRGFQFAPDLANYCAWFCPEEQGFFDLRFQLFREAGPEFFEVRSGLNPRPTLQGGSLPESNPTESPTDLPWQRTFRKYGIDHVVLCDNDIPAILPAVERMLSDPKQWTLLDLSGRAALFAWHDPLPGKQTAPPEVPPYDITRRAFGPEGAQPPVPADQTAVPTPATWWTRYALVRSRRSSADADEANMLLLYGNWLTEKARQEARQRAGLGQLTQTIAYGIDWSMSPPMLGLRWMMSSTMWPAVAANVPLQPAASLLAIQSAHRALAKNPDDALAYLQLGLAYRQLPELKGGTDNLAAQMRRHQATAALRHAVALDPDQQVAHVLLEQIYGELRFYDLVLKHHKERLRIARADMRRRKFTSPEEEQALQDQLATLEKEVKELDTKVINSHNEWTVSTLTKAPLIKAREALQRGLAEEAVNVLEQANPSELLNDKSSQGYQELLDLLFYVGKIDDVQESLGSAPEVIEGLEIKYFPTSRGTLQIPAYKWAAMNLAATTGNIKQADVYLQQMAETIQTPKRRQQVLEGWQKQVASNLPKLLLPTLPDAPPGPALFWKIWERFDRDQHLAQINRIFVPLPAEDLELATLRGLLALEVGDTKTAAAQFRHALALSFPIDETRPYLALIGVQSPLECLAVREAAANERTLSFIDFPSRPLAIDYLRRLEEAQKVEVRFGEK